MVAAVVATAVPVVRRASDDHSRSALAAACAAVSFLTVSFLFDSMAYTHVPYIFLTFAGLLVVLVTPEPVKRAVQAPRRKERLA
jgi:hypothetical protein